MTDDSSPIIDPDDPPPSDQYPHLLDSSEASIWDDVQWREPSLRGGSMMHDVLLGIAASQLLIWPSKLLGWVKARARRKRDEVEREQGYDD